MSTDKFQEMRGKVRQLAEQKRSPILEHDCAGDCFECWKIKQMNRWKSTSWELFDSIQDEETSD